MPINASLEQQGKLGYKKEIEIHDGQELLVKFLAGKQKKSYRVHLLALAKKGKSKFHIAWPWFWCAVLSVVALGIYMLVKQFVTIDQGIVELGIIFGCVAGIILGLVMLALKFSLKRVYFSRIAKVPLLDFEINKPNRRSYKSFIEKLDHNIAQMQEAYSLKADQQLAGELRTIRRLAQEGFVTQAAYDKAKGKLFKTPKK